jgi:murein DD-endopeptidase MepM/ murein hydrolase activator NlpD
LWAAACAGAGAAVVGGLLFVVVLTDPARPRPAAAAPVLDPPQAGSAALTFAAVVPSVDAGPAELKPAPPPVWRVAALASDPKVAVTEGAFGKKAFQAALTAAGLAPKEAQRLAHALQRVRRLDRLGEKDTFSLARDKATGRVIAFEMAASPVDVWQAREAEADKRLDAKKLDLYVDHKRVATAVVVGDDLRASVKQAGLHEEKLLDVLDDALDGHVGLADLRTGARLRIVADEEWVEGTFTRYMIAAVEYRAAQPTPEEAKKGPLRVYHLAKGDRHGALAYYDAKGQRPINGAWRSPIPMSRITSRFNPRRIHPVLHVEMPHNGVDFGAVTGTPVYSAGPGVVESVGDGGPCGNMVQVHHPNGLTTAYCHLSRFAPGLHSGEHVEARQLVGYVGKTGRATGPHLHFGVRRGDVFIDPLTLKLDGVRVVPPRDRDEFAAIRADMDAALDAIALPDLAAAPAAGADGGASADDEQNVENH